MSAPRSDGGGSARQRAKALGADNRVLLVLVLIYDFYLTVVRSRGVDCQCVDAHYVLLCVFEALNV